ncbi:UNVERIFIED_CONTAM: sugar ABC transporter ATP-binding protein, partial [Lactobacillus acidophilus]|nr:sugar ABC transporter ATP-binding protein [Lactobacillus acidophilus]
RVSMRAEIAKLHQRLSTTTIYVTHDQTEAMTMADRVVVMSVGEIQQIGTPSEIYDRPRNMFVAGFIGTPAMNFLNVHYQDQVIDDHKGVQLTIPEGMAKVLDKRGYNGKDIVFEIRPEDIHTEEIFIDTWPNSTVEATINVSELLGATSQLYSQVGNTEFVANVDS